LASRSDGRFERRVAIKFLNFALATEGNAERFKREGSILGRLAHPHIAELIDAGVTSNGSPYLVLEYVEGDSIDRYCNSRQLHLVARVRLFLDVVSAVAQAHANLIVHRDIKPSNVLVRNDGQVKLLDFGVAKILAEQTGLDEATSLTRNDGGALTPQFAAPEQVTGGTISTATDVYGLGVLLYLLLTGQHPAGAATGSPAQLVKAIVDTETVRPSGVVTAAAAEERSASRDKLSRQLRGDIDTILGKALKKNPQERYASVTAFGDDLRRYLANEPISARPDTFAYRARKFARRNRISLTFASLALAAIVAALGVAMYQASVARRRFQDVRHLAHTFVFDLHDQIARLEGSTKVRETMVTTALEYLDDLGHDAGNDLELQKEIAAAYEKIGDAQGYPTKPNLGHIADALVSYRKAGDIYRTIATKDPGYLADLAGYYVEYSGLVRFTHDLKQAREISESAIATFDQLRIRQKLTKAEEGKYTNAWCTVGDIDEDMGHYRQAWSEFSKCRDLARAGLDQAKDTEGLSMLAQADERVGTAAAELGRFSEALAAVDEDEAILKQLVAAEPQNPRLHRRQAIVNEFRADIYFSDFYPNRGDPVKGLEIEKRYLSAAEENVRRDPANTSAQFSHAVALFRVSVPLRENDPEAAVKMARESVREFDQLIAAGKPTYLLTSRRVRALWRLGEAQLKLGEKTDAIHTARMALDSEAGLTPDSNDMEEQSVYAYVFILAGRAYAANGELKTAEDFLARAREKAQALGRGGEVMSVLPLVKADRELAALYASEHRVDEARKCYQRVNDLWQNFPENSEYVVLQRKLSLATLTSIR
jgi:eukaryotic-like serine/threonine-protein kinase